VVAVGGAGLGGGRQGKGGWAEWFGRLVGDGIWFGAWGTGHHGAGWVGWDDCRPEAAVVEGGHVVAAFGNSSSGRQAMAAG